MSTFAIVGGGLSGTLVAAQLLRRAPPGTRILLIERRTSVGRGVAYGTTCPAHLVNVPAVRMSADPDLPGHFMDWVTARASRPGYPTHVEPTDFLPRWLYGEYIEDVLTEARSVASSGVHFEIVSGEVVDLEEVDGHGRLLLASGDVLEADRVVLALGNLPGEYPILRSLPVYRSPRYVHFPWRPDALDGIGIDDDVLLVGQGLTATDLIVQLDSAGHRGTIHALSRNGLHVQVHQPAPSFPSFLTDEPSPKTVRALVRRVRAEVRTAARLGVDWRPVIDGLRPHAQSIWQGLSWDERARFLRHVRPFWEIHRHRLAPPTAAVIERLAAEGRLKFYAGRLQVLEADETGVQALFRRRGTIQHVSLHVAKIINCTGPRTDYSKYQHPLFIHLLARGLMDHDPLALGINALPTGEMLRYRGGPTGWLFTLGPPLKGVLWESTGVREIRAQAKALAETLLAV